MASITIRNVEDTVKARLRVRAAQQGRWMEEEARQILRHALDDQSDRRNLADLAEALFGDKGVELEPHPAVPTCKPPDFGADRPRHRRPGRAARAWLGVIGGRKGS